MEYLMKNIFLVLLSMYFLSGLFEFFLLSRLFLMLVFIILLLSIFFLEKFKCLFFMIRMLFFVFFRGEMDLMGTMLEMLDFFIKMVFMSLVMLVLFFGGILDRILIFSVFWKLLM